MNLKFIKAGAAVTAVIGAAFLSANQAWAYDEIEPAGMISAPYQIEITEVVPKGYLAHATAGIEARVEEERLQKEAEEEARKQAERAAVYENIAFAKVDKGSYLNIRKQAKTSSAWIGRLYADNAAKVIKVVGKKGKWLQIQSGDVIGFVKAEYMITGEKALEKARELVAKANPDADIDTLEPEVIRASFASAKSKKTLNEESKKKGKELVAFANQFIGNPYVWGGMSLTNGADCSGFVKAVYAKYGVSLPHSSYGMRRVGREVEFKDIRKGDIVCYEGHVGIYAGNSQIVNAVDESKGIRLSSVTYTHIITIRRIF